MSLLLENAPLATFPRPIRAMILPHGPFTYSGGVAARAFRLIMSEPLDAIVVIAPILTERYDFISVFPGKALETPLGNLLVDQPLCRRLSESHPDIQLSQHGFQAGEHTLEVQLPFLKWVQHQTPIVPVMIGRQSREAAGRLADSLAGMIAGRRILVTASSNLSSEIPDPEARAQDRSVMGSIESFNEEQLFQDAERGRIEMSGIAPVFAAMRTARALGAREGKVLLYRNSGDITGLRDQVTGYVSAVFF